MLIITGSYTVVPCESTPKRRFPLSESDQIVPWTLSPSIYIYRPDNNNGAIPQATERMRDSLSKILVHYYPVAGRVHWIDGGKLGLDCNAMGVKLLEAESSKTLAEYGDFAPSEATNELIPTADYSRPLEEIPLLMVQLTRFKGGEDLAIGVALSHTLVDGVAAIRFINSWAKLARGEALDQEEMSPFLDRTVLNRSKRHPLSADSAPSFHHPEFSPFPLLSGSSDNTTERKKETSVALLSLTSEQVQKLKKKTNDQPQTKGSRPYSRYEAVSAHIWRSASKARQGDNHQPTVVRIPTNIRNRMDPPLPRNYFGNALLPTVTPTCYSGEIISNTLSFASQKIREAIEKLTDEYMRSQFARIASHEKLDCIRASFHVQGSRGSREAPFYGNPNLSIVSWMGMPVYEADFGWGKPVYMGPGALSTDGQVYILPSPGGDGSVAVAIRLQIAHMQLFHKFFYEDI